CPALSVAEGTVGTSNLHAPAMGDRGRLCAWPGNVDADWPGGDDPVPAGRFDLLLHALFRARDEPRDCAVPTDYAGLSDRTARAAFRGMVLLHGALLSDALAARILRH